MVMVKSWEELGPQIWTFLHSSVQMNMIRVRLPAVHPLHVQAHDLQPWHGFKHVLHAGLMHDGSVTQQKGMWSGDTGQLEVEAL